MSKVVLLFVALPLAVGVVPAEPQNIKPNEVGEVGTDKISISF